MLAAKPDLGERGHDAALGVAEAVYGDGSAERLVDRLVRMQRSVGILEDHLDDLSGFARTAVAQFSAVDHHAADGMRDQAGDGAKDGGLAGAGFADQAQRVAGRNAKRHIAGGAHQRGAGAVGDGDAFEFDQEAAPTAAGRSISHSGSRRNCGSSMRRLPSSGRAASRPLV